MSGTSVASIEDNGFSAKAALDGARMILSFWGNADLRAKEKLDLFLDKADERAMAAKSEEVVVDFRELVFMNSSCLKAVVTWLTKVQDRPNAEQYRIVFLKEPAAHWQTRSLHALVSFAPGLIRVE
jgi:hypothetical protein